MFLRHIHCIHTPASIFFSDVHPRYSSYAHVLEPAARPNSGQKRVVSALLAQAGMHLARGQHFSNLRTTMPEQPLRASRMPRGCPSSEACQCGWRGGGSERVKNPMGQKESWRKATGKTDFGDFELSPASDGFDPGAGI